MRSKIIFFNITIFYYQWCTLGLPGIQGYKILHFTVFMFILNVKISDIILNFAKEVHVLGF